jgi:hypothetical protein
MSQPGLMLLLHSPEMVSPPAPNDPPEVLPDMSPIVSQWQQLASMDRESPDFLPLLSSLTAGVNRSLATMLRGDDARIALGAIDKVSRPFVAKAV